MPSGGHGSRGGRSGGGSRGFSGGSRGRSMGGSRHFGSHRPMPHGPMHHPHRHIRIRIGGHYYGYSEGGSPLVALILFFIIFAGMIVMSTGVFRSGAKAEMELCEAQHEHYHGMIDYAKEHNEYIVKATVTSRWHDEETGKYWLDYVINSNGVKLEGYTYPCYTLAQTNGLVGNEIDVVVDGLPITHSTDSIDLAFENVTLDEDADYLIAQKSYRNTSIAFWVSLVITILLIVLLVWYSIKKLKLDDDEKPAEVKTENTKTYCSYCGTACSSSATRCPNCGANLR